MHILTCFHVLRSPAEALLPRFSPSLPAPQDCASALHALPGLSSWWVCSLPRLGAPWGGGHACYQAGPGAGAGGWSSGQWRALTTAFPSMGLPTLLPSSLPP